MAKKNQIGIDLGQHEIKIALIEEVKVSTELNYLKDYESYPVENDVAMYSDEYFATLKDAIKDFAKKIKKSSLSLNFVLPPSDDARVLFTNMPSVNKKDLESGVKFEVEQLVLDKKPSDYKYTWKVVNTYQELNQYDVMIAILDNKLLNYFSKFKTINWKINRIMIQPIILEKIAKNDDVIIDIGSNETRIYMYKAGSLTKVEIIKIGGSSLTTAVNDYIQRNNIVTEKTAEEILQQSHTNITNFTDYYEYKENTIEEETYETIDSQEIFEITNSIVVQIIEEAKLAIRSFELENSVMIENIYYLGGAFEIGYLESKLEDELDSDVKPFKVLAKDIESLAYEMAGLSTKSPDLKDKMDFSNFIKANVDYASILTATLTVSASTLIALSLLSGSYDKTIEEQTATVQEQQTEISNVTSKISEYQIAMEDNKRFLQKIDSLKSQKKWLSDALFVIPDITPLTVVVDKIKIVDSNVTIEGYSSDYSSIGFFAKKLENHGNVTINSIDEFNQDEATEIIYSVVTDNPEQISDKYKMGQKFSITLSHGGFFLER